MNCVYTSTYAYTRILSERKKKLFVIPLILYAMSGKFAEGKDSYYRRILLYLSIVYKIYSKKNRKKLPL